MAWRDGRVGGDTMAAGEVLTGAAGRHKRRHCFQKIRVAGFHATRTYLSSECPSLFFVCYGFFSSSSTIVPRVSFVCVCVCCELCCDFSSCFVKLVLLFFFFNAVKGRSLVMF